MQRLIVLITIIVLFTLMTGCKNNSSIPYESRADISYAISSENNLPH